MKFLLGQQVKANRGKIKGVIIGISLEITGDETYQVHIAVDNDDPLEISESEKIQQFVKGRGYVPLMTRDEENDWENSDVYKIGHYNGDILTKCNHWEIAQLLTHRDPRIRKASQFYYRSTNANS